MRWVKASVVGVIGTGKVSLAEAWLRLDWRQHGYRSPKIVDECYYAVGLGAGSQMGVITGWDWFGVLDRGWGLLYGVVRAWDRGWGFLRLGCLWHRVCSIMVVCYFSEGFARRLSDAFIVEGCD